MRRVGSLQRLLDQWETTEVPQNFVYKNFEYQVKEFENVPSIVPRFLLYLQQNLKPIAQNLKYQQSLQTVAQLKDECLQMFKIQAENMNQKEHLLNQRDFELTKTCQELQAQIDQINASRVNEKEQVSKMAAETLMESQHLMYPEFKSMRGKCEYPATGYLNNVDNEAWIEPRMFTLKQLRDTFWTFTHNSLFKRDIDAVKPKLDLLSNQVTELQERDKVLEALTNSSKERLELQLTQLSEHVKEELFNVDRQSQMSKSKFNSIDSQLNIARTNIDEIKRMVQKHEERQSELDLKIVGLRDTLTSDLAGTKNDLSNGLKSTKDYFIEQLLLYKQETKQGKDAFDSIIDGIKQSFKSELKQEGDVIKTYVLQLTTAASAHRDTLQDTYMDKLDQVKEVCAQYFTKYEKQLHLNTTNLKDMEKQQQEWIAQIIKPQADNQAKVFSIETRLHQVDQNRDDDYRFFKDLIRKFIIAIEQHHSSIQQAQQVLQLSQAQNLERPSSKDPTLSLTINPHQSFMTNSIQQQDSLKTKPRRNGRSVMLSQGSRATTPQITQTQRISVADVQFGHAPALPQSNSLIPYGMRTSTALSNAPTLPPANNNEERDRKLNLIDQQLRTSLSEFTTNNSLGQTQNQNDILFLKRLLFLKASIDNQ